MDIGYEIATYLADAGFGTLNTDIFVGQIPTETEGLYVVRTGGTLNYYLPVEESVLDIYAQYISAQTCVQTLERVKRFIHRMIDTETENAVIYAVLALGDIEDVARDQEYKKVFKVTIQVRHRASSVIS